MYFFISLVVWVGSMISIFIVSLGSLIGVVATPFTRKFWFPYVIMFLIALAVAVLVGDAALHLLPHVSGFPVSMWYPVPESTFTHSIPMFHFYTPSTRQKTRSFLRFSGGIENKTFV